MTAVFDRCYVRLLELEGVKLTDDPEDAGGLTKFGISKLAYPEEDIANLTPERAKFLMHRDYWLAVRGDDLNNAEIAFQQFEMAFHSDPRGFPFRATLCAQAALICLGVNVTLDGRIGPQTIKALNTYTDKNSLLQALNLFQGCFLLVGAKGLEELKALIEPRLPQLQRFLKGWLRRLVHFPA